MNESEVFHALDLFLIGSPFRDTLSDAILKLSESQRLQILYDKWWKEKGVAAACDAEEAKGDASALGIANVGGTSMFILIICSKYPYITQSWPCKSESWNFYHLV